MNKIIVALLLAAPLAIAALPAAAEENQTACTTEPAAKWMSEDAAKAKATELGYDVRDLKTENSCFEIYAVKDGQKVQLVMNPVDGAIEGDEGEND